MRTFAQRAIGVVLYNCSMFGVVMFATAQTFRWWRAWALLGVITITTVIDLLTVLRRQEGLLRERMKPVLQKGQPVADKIVLVLFMVSYGGQVAVAGLDVFHWHLFPQPPLIVSFAGMLMFLIGWWLIRLTFEANAFATVVVRHQTEREHVVVDTGIYRFVRHPLYAGVSLGALGMALWLESYAAAIAALLPIALLAIRIGIEEKFLCSALGGYEAYTQRVRYRLIPKVW
jgi:protein-S-isoprenylcysteine O-methyltransferase Ste14